MRSGEIASDSVRCEVPVVTLPPSDSGDVAVLRAALTREATERRRAECLAKIQTDVVKIAVDLLAREPDIEGFFRALLQTLADEGESHKVSVWLVDDDEQGCHLWMAHLNGEILIPTRAEASDRKSTRLN